MQECFVTLHTLHVVKLNAGLLICDSFVLPGVVTVGELLRNKEAFTQAVQEHMNVDPAALLLLMETPLPNNTEVSQELHVFLLELHYKFPFYCYCSVPFI